MVTKKPTAKIPAKNTLVVKHSKLYKTLLWTVPLAIILGTLGVIGWNNLPWNADRAQMISYLKDKYGSDFSVANIHEEGGGIGVPGDMIGEVTTPAEPAVKFQIFRSTNSPIGNYHDTYLQELWSYQAKQKVDKFVSELGNVEGYIVTVLPDSTWMFKQPYPATGRTIGIDEALEKYPEKVTYTLSVRSSIDATSSEPSQGELERAYGVVVFVKKQNIQDSKVYYLYKDLSYVKHDESGQTLYQYSIDVTKNISSINAPSDLQSYFKKIR